MPELPEVETTLRGISPYLVGKTIREVTIRERRMRWPIPKEVDRLAGCKVKAATRRAKYLLFETDSGHLLLHLGMSGSLRIATPSTEWRKHDHVAFRMSSGKELRFYDPRRFGCVLFCKGDPMKHRLIRNLGPEPLDDAFNVNYLAALAKGKKVAIKQFIMNAHIVVGVGNIYASESLFMASISPKLSAGKVSKPRVQRLVDAIKAVLVNSIKMGGTTLRDFLHEDGQPGYFKQSLRVYDREDDPCLKCETSVKRIIQSGRSTFFCPTCQR